jgi:leucyl aminopeptidase (aminopeptidase T)
MVDLRTHSLLRRACSVVAYNLRIDKEDVVLVGCSPHTLYFAEELVRELYNRNAVAYIHLISDQILMRYFRKSSAFLRRENDTWLRILRNSTCTISLVAPSEPEKFREISVTKPRLQLLRFLGKRVFQERRRRKIRGAYLAIARVSPQWANLYGFDYEKWKRAMLDAISYEASELARTGRALLDRAGSSGNMVITHENGSNLEVGFDPEGSTIMDEVVDGVKRLWADLPEGIVAFPVIKGRVDGTIEFNLPLIVSGRGLAELDSEV